MLVVDDTRVHQRILGAMVKKCGFEADFAATGREAVELARETEYSLVFMDCNMPDFDGMAATAAIKKLLGEGAPPVIGVTADTDDFAHEQCLAAGMDDFIPKPHTAAQIKELVKKWAAR